MNNIFGQIRRYTNIEAGKFLQDFLEFMDNEHNDILNYFTSYEISYPKEAFEKFNDLRKRCDTLIEKLILHKGKFSTVDYWNLFEQIDDIKYKLELIPTYPRLYKVSFIKKQNESEEPDYEYRTLRQHETLSNVANELNQDVNDIALLNYLTEEDYTRKGGTTIILKESSTSENPNYVEIQSILDIALGKNLLGRDIKKKIIINEEERDIEIDNPNDTFYNTVKRLFVIVKGSIPEYPNLGIDKQMLQMTVAESENTLPIILRQLTEVINTDDTIADCMLVNIEKAEASDAFKISYEVYNQLRQKMDFINYLEDEDEEDE